MTTHLCKCADPRFRHRTGEGLEPCTNPACGCQEYRLDPRSLLEAAQDGKSAATGEGSAAAVLRVG